VWPNNPETVVNPTDPTPPPAPVQPQYEFDDTQNKVIDDLATSIAWVGGLLFIVAIGYGLNSVVHFVQVGRNTAELVPAGLALIGAIFFYLLAKWLGTTANAFDRVTHTRGFDVTHLMTGLQNLRKTFGLLATLIQVYLVVLFVALVVALVLTFTGR
jgi:uncharacterized membrane protein YjdF